jgi:DNA polymerase IV
MQSEPNIKRKIIHVDMDCFFAAVEMRDHPEYRNIPLAVGGTSPRSVLSTCNYQARKYGIKSAMPSMLAKKLCPNLKIVNGSYAKYKEASLHINEIFQDYTDLIQPLSLDEAFLDVSSSEKYFGSATLLAKEIKQRIYQKTKLVASAGVAPNKFLAKIASDWKKPDGLFTIPPKNIAEFVKQLPIRRLPGVGAVTAKKLYDLGIKNCLDIQNIENAILEEKFGIFTRKLKAYSYGIDHSKVSLGGLRKSLSIERTFPTDLSGFHTCRQELTQLEDEIGRRILSWKTKNKIPQNCLKSIFLKMKTYDFQTITIEKSFDSHFFNSIWDQQVFDPNHESIVDKLCLDGLDRIEDKGIRLIGLGFRMGHKKLDTEQWYQLNLFSNV